MRNVMGLVPAVKSQSAYLTSKQILPFGFAWQYTSEQDYINPEAPAPN